MPNNEGLRENLGIPLGKYGTTVGVCNGAFEESIKYIQIPVTNNDQSKVIQDARELVEKHLLSHRQLGTDECLPGVAFLSEIFKKDGKELWMPLVLYEFYA